MEFETVCGLEVHTELSTKTKIFCSCTTDFGGEPDTHCCEVCTGMPGALPVLNEKVLEYAVRCGLALNCEITRCNKFDRKNYFYPDLPKGYQISQLYLPVCRNGWVEINDSVNGGKKRVRIHEIHMEEDAGKLIHCGEKSLVNYNRAGVPLLEIVSEPDIANGTEAAEYTEKLREILMFIGISDCKMQEGSLRADVNVSVREKGSGTLGTRTEMKNLSSFRAVKSAVDGEAKRQIKVIERGGTIVQQTRRFDEKSQISYPMRTKETAQDYKYFPEPDIPPLVISEEYIENIKDNLSELPDEKKKRYIKMGLTEYDADLICTDMQFVRLFEATAEITGLPKITANWVTGEVMALHGGYAVEPELLGEIINLVKDGKITRETAKETFVACLKEKTAPADYISRNGLEITDDNGVIDSVVLKVVRLNSKAVKEYLQGKEKSFNYLVGQCMRELKGKAAPDKVRDAVNRAIEKGD